MKLLIQISLVVQISWLRIRTALHPAYRRPFQRRRLAIGWAVSMDIQSRAVITVTMASHY